jgi:CO dehydrogenase nickel-insertion accessory protein CooC1
MATILQRKAYEVMVLDGDASNPEGLVRLLFGLGVEGEPKPLIEFFGGVNAVTCPVDDQSPLTRVNDSNPVPENRINFSKEISADESVSIAKRIDEFCQEVGIRNFWLILNKIGSEEVESMLMDKLLNLRNKVIGSISYDQELIKAGLSGNALSECKALEEVEHIVERLEQVVSF